MEYIIEAADGSTRNEWREPAPDVGQLKARILEILEQRRARAAGPERRPVRGGQERPDRRLARRSSGTRTPPDDLEFRRVKVRRVALTPIPVADVLGGGADRRHDGRHAWPNLRPGDVLAPRAELITSIFKAAGWMVGGIALEYAIIGPRRRSSC